jgi:small GTP-binding protein
VKVWDTAGQERFHTITQQFYKQAHGMIIAFDLTNRKSFENVRAWIDSIYRHSSDTSLPKVLVGNKVDLADANSQELRAVMKSEAIKLASEHDISYFETSAKENLNITELMQHIMSKVYENLYRKNQLEEAEEGK